MRDMGIRELNEETDENEVSHLFLQELDDRYRPLGGYHDQLASSESPVPQIPSLIVQNIRELLQHYPQGIPSLKLEREYFKLFKSKLNYQQWGYDNLSRMLWLNSNVFLLKKVDSQTARKYPEFANDFTVYDVRDKSTTLELNYDFKIKLVRLIFKYSATKEPFPIYRWVEIYRKTYNEPELTFNQVDHVTLFQALAREFPIELYFDQSRPENFSVENREFRAMELDINEEGNIAAIKNEEQVKESIAKSISGDVSTAAKVESITESKSPKKLRPDSGIYDVRRPTSADQEEMTVLPGQPNVASTVSPAKTASNEANADGIRLDHYWVKLNDEPIRSGNDGVAPPKELSISPDDSLGDKPPPPKITQALESADTLKEIDLNTSANNKAEKPSSKMLCDFEESDTDADMAIFLKTDDDDSDEPKDQPIDAQGRISNICPSLCARIKPLQQVLKWRSRMVETGLHKLVIDLYEHNEKLPRNVCLPGEKFIHFKFPYEAINEKSGAKVHQVVIIAASNPSHVYVNLIHDGFNELKTLNSDIIEYFGTSKEELEKFLVPTDFIYNGFPCLIQATDDKTNEKVWERSRIIGISQKAEDSVIVESVDFGGFKAVNSDQIFLVPRKFMSLPAQAIHVSMIGLNPRDGQTRWSPEAGKRIRNFSWEGYHLDCIFLERKMKDDLPAGDDKRKFNTYKFPLYEVVLCDRHDPDLNIFLDEALVIECLADRDASRSKETEELRKVLIERMPLIKTKV